MIFNKRIDIDINININEEEIIKDEKIDATMTLAEITTHVCNYVLDNITREYYEYIGNGIIIELTLLIYKIVQD